MKTVVLLEDVEGHMYVRDLHQVKDGIIKVSVFDWEIEDGGGFVTEPLSVVEKRRFLVDIYAKFIMNGNSPYTVRRGMREINAIAYSYCVNIFDISRNRSSLYPTSDEVYTKSGMEETHCDMYAYCTRDEKGLPIGYNERQLMYEVEASLNLQEILFKKFNSNQKV